MALKKCKDCGASISKSAKVCPNCGKPQHRAGCFSWGIAIFIILTVIGTIISVLSDRNNFNYNTPWLRMKAAMASQDIIKNLSPDREISFAKVNNNNIKYDKEDKSYIVNSTFFITSNKDRKIGYLYLMVLKYNPKNRTWSKEYLKSLPIKH